jgi:hypothetical protein
MLEEGTEGQKPPASAAKLTGLIIDALFGVPFPEEIYWRFMNPCEHWSIISFNGEYSQDYHFEAEYDPAMTQVQFVDKFVRELLENIELGNTVFVNCLSATMADADRLRLLCVAYATLLHLKYEIEEDGPLIQNNIHPCGLLHLDLSPELTSFYFLTLAALTQFNENLTISAQYGNLNINKALQYLNNYPVDMIAFASAEIKGNSKSETHGPWYSQSFINYASWWKGAAILRRLEGEAKLSYGSKDIELMKDLHSGAISGEMEDIIEGFIELSNYLPLSNDHQKRLVDYAQKLKAVYLEK